MDECLLSIISAGCGQLKLKTLELMCVISGSNFAFILTVRKMVTRLCGALFLRVVAF